MHWSSDVYFLWYTYKNYWEEVHLSFRFRLCLFKVHQNREIWPPQFPIHKCRIPVVNWGVSRLHWSFKFVGSTERLTSNGFFRPQRHFHLIPEAAHLLLPPIWPQISRPCKAQWSLEMPAKRKINNSIQCIKDMSWHWLQVGKKNSSSSTQIKFLRRSYVHFHLSMPR